MNILYQNAKITRKNKTECVDFLVYEGKFKEIAPHIDPKKGDQVIDLQNSMVLPGLFDIHTHGALGYDFNMATFDEMKIIMDYYMQNGVTSVLPTIMTDDIQTIKKQLKLLAKLKPLYPIMQGIHLEGPFLSLKYKGAQPESAILKPDVTLFKALMEDSNHLINYTTLAPEIEGAIPLIDGCKALGVRVTLGHSDASFDQTNLALKHGASSFTHMFNAMRPFDHHGPGIVGAALMSNAYTEMIMDGKHLDKDTVLFLKKIRGLNHLIIITDSIMAAGLKDGFYKLGQTPIVVKDGDARLVSNHARAGSTLNPFQAIVNFSRFTHTKLSRAVDLMSINPARMLGLDHVIGSIDIGKYADFILVDGEKLKAVYSRGNKVYQKE